jgi:hypothetical protein
MSNPQIVHALVEKMKTLDAKGKVLILEVGAQPDYMLTPEDLAFLQPALAGCGAIAFFQLPAHPTSMQIDEAIKYLESKRPT